MESNEETAKPLLTVAEVSSWLHVSASLVYQLVESGKIPFHRIGNGRGAIRFAYNDVEDYIAASRKQPEEAREQRVNRPRLKHLRLK